MCELCEMVINPKSVTTLSGEIAKTKLLIRLVKRQINTLNIDMELARLNRMHEDILLIRGSRIRFERILGMEELKLLNLKWLQMQGVR